MKTSPTENLTIVLITPQIPPNTGNIARLCAANDIPLHLVGKLGFQLDDKHLKRAGMDYWDYVNWAHHENVDHYFEYLKTVPFYFFTSKTTQSYTQVTYPSNTHLVFGSENTGLDETWLNQYPKQCVTIPMISRNDKIRCLNLSTAAGIGLYEGLKQQGNNFDK